MGISYNKYCFVISPIGDIGTDIYIRFKNILDHVIKPTVLSSGLEIEVLRADEIQGPGSIIKDIVNYLRFSKVVIADLTGKNPNVFYELGVRHSFELRTILIAQDISDVPSDLRDYRTIIYSTSSKKSIMDFNNKLKGYLKEIIEYPDKLDNPVLGYLRESGKTFINYFDPIYRRRWLANAMCGLPSLTAISEVAQHLAQPTSEHKAILELPAVLASTLHLRNTFIFRHNTTQAFRDCLETIFRHELWHKSRRGEEGADIARIAKSGIDYFSDPPTVPVGTLVYSDVEHPAITHMIKQIWPESALKKPVRISDIILQCDYHKNGYSSPSEEILSRYINVLSDTRSSVVILPHVVWINGAVLDVVNICREIKRRYPLITTIIDGAQVPGHIPLQIETVERENCDIDFYVSSGHKWLCGPESIGFSRVGCRYNEECPVCRQFLITSDLVTDASTISLSYQGLQIGTQQRGIAKGLLCALKEFQSSKEEQIAKIKINAIRIRELLKKRSNLKIMGPPEIMSSGIVSICGADIDQLFINLQKAKFNAVLYNIPQDISFSFLKVFMRLSPGPELNSTDFKELELLFRNNQGK